MEYIMYKNKKVSPVDGDDKPKSFRELISFLNYNGGRDCFTKSLGHVYKITRKGAWVKVCHNLGDKTFTQYLKESLE